MNGALTNGSLSRLRQENIRLRKRLAETEATLRAIGNGDVDAVVVNGRGGQKVYSLQDAENLYRRLAETIREPTLALNDDNIIIFFNDRFQEIVGSASEQIVGLEVYDLIHGDDCDAFRSLLRGARESGAPEGRARVLSRQGLAVPVYWRANCLDRDDGKMICLVGTDLSQLEASALAVEQLKQQQDELIATHNELERSRERYADLYDSAPVGYLTLSGNGRIRAINVTGAQVLGRPRHKLIRTPLLTLVDRQDRKRLLTHLALCRRRGDRMSTEVRLNAHGGASPEYIELISSPASESFPRGEEFKSVISDITARKRAELALRDSEERFRTMADAAPVMIWIAGPDKQCNYFNKPWLEFTGRSLEQELGDGWTESVHPDDLKRFISIFSQSFDARKQFRMEYRVRRCDGEYRWLLDHGLPNFSAAHQFLGYVGSCVDITDRKRMESALQAAARLSRENPSPVMRLGGGRVLSFMNRAGQPVATRWRCHLGDEVPLNVARIASRALSKGEREHWELSVGRRRFDVLFAPIPHGGYVNLYFNDVTERRRAEKALRAAHDDLERRVQQRTRELRRCEKIQIPAPHKPFRPL